MYDKDFDSIIELLEAFPDEQSCSEQLKLLRWKNGVASDTAMIAGKTRALSLGHFLMLIS